MGIIFDNILGAFRSSSDGATEAFVSEEFAKAGGSTGVTYFEGISINADTSRFDVGAVTGYITTQGANPTRVYHSFPASTGNTSPYINTSAVTEIAIDGNGDLVLQDGNIPWTELQRRTLLLLGQITHINGAPITKAASRPNLIVAPSTRLEILAEAIGKLNISGNVFSAVGGTLSMQKTAGSVYSHSSNYQADPNEPDTISQPALNPCEIQHVTSVGVDAVNNFIDPDNYEVAGVKTPMANNKWSLQRIYLFDDNNLAVTYGTVEYASEADAIAGVNTEDPPLLGSVEVFGTLRGYIVSQKGMVDSSLMTFIEAGKFI